MDFSLASFALGAVAMLCVSNVYKTIKGIRELDNDDSHIPAEKSDYN